MKFSEDQVKRYSRHILLPEVGGKGQEKLLNAKVFITGAGGLGSPAALYLAAAGIGKMGIADFDTVDLSNLQRQILHSTPDVGRLKVESAQQKLNLLNPDVDLKIFRERLCKDNIREIIRDYDIVLDGSDNFPTRFLVNDACYMESKTLVSGSMFRFDGQITTLKPRLGFPCYRCIYPEPPPPGLVPSCQEAGILGAIAGVVGSIQAVEALKEILGVGKSLAGRLLIFNAKNMTMSEMKVRKDPKCPLCGEAPAIKELIDYDQSCRIGP